jgi:hypothetical protein
VVAHDQDLEVRVALREERRQGPAQQLLSTHGGDRDRDEGIGMGERRLIRGIGAQRVERAPILGLSVNEHAEHRVHPLIDRRAHRRDVAEALRDRGEPRVQLLGHAVELLLERGQTVLDRPGALRQRVQTAHDSPQAPGHRVPQAPPDHAV